MTCEIHGNSMLTVDNLRQFTKSYLVFDCDFIKRLIKKTPHSP